MTRRPGASVNPRVGRTDDAERQEAGTDPTDEELDRFILLRLRQLGIDLSVLPEDDADAPADRRRILRSARRFLRNTPPDILAFEMDAQAVAPAMYPAETARRTRRSRP